VVLALERQIRARLRLMAAGMGDRYAQGARCRLCLHGTAQDWT
jgi:hypothetical protein